MYKMGGEDGVGDASEKSRRGDQDERGKTQGDVRAAVFNRCRTKRVLERTSCVVDAARMEMI